MEWQPKEVKENSHFCQELSKGYIVLQVPTKLGYKGIITTTGEKTG